MILEIAKALNCLNNEGILIYPSDTIWAIGCDATNLKAINKIYKIKKRNRSKPLICLMNDIKISVEGGRLILKNENGCNLTRDYGITKIYVSSPNLIEIRNGLIVQRLGILQMHKARVNQAKVP